MNTGDIHTYPPTGAQGPAGPGMVVGGAITGGVPGSPLVTDGAGNLGQTVGLVAGVTTQTGATYAVAALDFQVIANRAGTVTLTLPDPTAAAQLGRLLLIRTIQAQTVVSDASNVVPLAGGSAGTAILANTAGKFALLQANGTAWLISVAN